MSKPLGDIRAGRLPAQDYAEHFGDVFAPLTAHQAAIEADRCYFCFAAPCQTACPTGIDIPSFIRKIGSGNLKGAAADILDANILGASCARVCPTEVLCEGACVRNSAEHKPVTIGLLQRHATDWLFGHGIQLFERAAATGKHIAVVGAGPAGLACAHKLATLGHAVTIFEAGDKPGGLNEYGIAAYKLPHGIAQREIAYLLEIGGITLRYNQALGRDVQLDDLRRDHDAVFLAMGLAGVNTLDLAGEDSDAVVNAVTNAVTNAVDYIATLRQAEDLACLPVGRRVVVIGGGMTAVDIAVQSRRLGAEEVTIVYRRGAEHMGASQVEQEWAQTNGVRIRHWARPLRLVHEDGVLARIEFATTDARDETFTLDADMVFKAIGQSFVALGDDQIGAVPTLRDGRIAVDAQRQTSLDKVWAGGDCVADGPDLTVAAVQDGKLAALAIHHALGAVHG